jgi:hypothetical protein
MLRTVGGTSFAPKVNAVVKTGGYTIDCEPCGFAHALQIT